MRNISIEELSLLSRLTRWQNLPTVTSESVAEHTAQVALIVLKLSADYEFDVGKALTIALLHDVAEISLTDIPHNVTRRFPMIADAKALAEREVIAEKLPEYEAWLTQPSLEADIVKLADVLQVLQFCDRELNVCTNRYIQKVAEEAQQSAEALYDKLQVAVYKRQGRL